METALTRVEPDVLQPKVLKTGPASQTGRTASRQHRWFSSVEKPGVRQPLENQRPASNRGSRGPPALTLLPQTLASVFDPPNPRTSVVVRCRCGGCRRRRLFAFPSSSVRPAFAVQRRGSPGRVFTVTEVPCVLMNSTSNATWPS
ncbi:hypothetical protein PIB30_004101 [Stylosanthes scabra]|uniref:Uncharacterized protein n=1 Tax=Stylosanthes scabra TaxID=79078 RepID=A0ABU6Z431_9FABA|nr:hypothetical protein [Stylosanthes scabra]